MKRKPCVVRWTDSADPEFGACLAHPADFKAEDISAELVQWCASFSEAHSYACELNAISKKAV